MFDWFDKTFGRREYPSLKDVPPLTDMEKIAKDMNKVIPFPTPKPAAKEHYRVGLRDDGMTTLTVIAPDNHSAITLSMNEAACEQLIKMLRATYDNGTESTS